MYLHTFTRPHPAGTDCFPSPPADNYTLPHPLRLYESEDCAVELVMACAVDAELPDLPASNYLAQLHWYGSDGSHHRLDVRRLIRQHRKKVPSCLIYEEKYLSNYFTIISILFLSRPFLTSFRTGTAYQAKGRSSTWRS